ncbi:hypothetical protein H2200_012786 [Cladophialophora chaetospira]|uniref:Putative phospholipase n=1 Tax=Cladophialophora chaetospira TaxID=386627 RepID=A0AA38WWS8_9EURO|nr:hypothetical protein H2200_012786 [Cladophialophora chaetospira]
MGSLIWERLSQRIWHIVHPRATWRYILCVGLATFVVFRGLSTSSPLMSSNLPQYTGPYNVGTIDVEVPVETRSINNATFREGGHAAFKLETVLFTLYYPATKGAVSSKPHHLWVPKPLSITGQGYARFAHISNFVTDSLFTFGLWGLVGGTKIPAHVDVPLHGSPDFHNEPLTTEDGFPVMIFSHGMASTRTDYTQYVGELASRGFIVAAIEHRDGSGPGTQITIQRKRRSLLHFNVGHLTAESGLDSDTFREAQLDFRQAEVEETVRVLNQINRGQGKEVLMSNSRKEGQSLHQWGGRLAMNNATIGGHSFGATLALQTLKDGPSKALPFQGAVVLDPGKQSGPLNHDVRVPTLILHSNSWSKQHSVFFGRPHFDVVKEVVQGILRKGKDAWFMTSLGTSHPSVTDAPLIEPWLLSFTTGATIDVHEGVHQYVQVTERFLRFQQTGAKEGILSECVTYPEYKVVDEHRPDSGRLPEVFRKYWQIHAAPCGGEAL